ncbi:MAG: phenol hydroxylase subunit P4 [Burkholderiaceae bacterium]|jgi:phenol hydroxylase P4 protein|nr:phenol hydroxylase subunit P4 [Burkholderiaceae bacterium]
MSTKAIAAYDFPQRDTVDKFPAPLLYIGWDDHKMFCSPLCIPVPPATRFGDWVQSALPGMFGAHPDFARIDWNRVEWFSSGKPFKPDMNKTMAENGLGHKSMLRLRTPGLTGLGGSCF